MAARKKAARRKTSGRRRRGRTRAQLLKALGKAQREVRQLLRASDRGTLATVILRTGLVEIGKRLDYMEPLEIWDL